jgi:hypothetical protein
MNPNEIQDEIKTVDTAEAQAKFAETVDVKRQMTMLREKEKDLAAYWKGLAAAELPDGRGRIMVLPDTKNGMSFAVKKSGVSKTKLRELGVSEEILAKAEGTYVGWELF